ncbi:hypothetical protein GN244_ATG00528 [Phytophthora infestans]|uniref:Secreted RxLR effector peptide protein n=1 Tax=Phytophthora infestans TaxID=4787 RepID=A0A833TCA7_PHYIN|nr:hypothetical protein GN244_ATG00528 [Phytophthora infestans]
MFKHALVAVLIQASFTYQAAGHGNIFEPNPQGADEAHRFYYGGPAGSFAMPELVGKYSYGEYYKGGDSWFTKNNVDSVKDFVKHHCRLTAM